MPAVQTTYNQTLVAWFLGQRINMELSNVISRVVEDAAGIGFGIPVVRGTNANGCKAATALGDTVGSVSALGAGNSTGNGTFSAPSVAAGTLPGVWTVEFDDATHFVVSDPNGSEVGRGTAGVAYGGTAAAGPGFTFTAGGTPQAAGDTFQVTVAQSGGGTILGITVRDETLLPPGDPLNTTAGDIYPQYSTAGIETRSPMAVMAGATVAAGDDAYFVPSTGRWTNVAGTTNVPYTGAKFDSAGANGNLVALRLAQK